jgi:hypothetical protein
MRLARGFFRLWIVASIVWVVGVVSVTLREENILDWARSGTNTTGTTDRFDPDEYLAFKRDEAIKTAAKIALIPPVLMLAFGSALGWAIRGFRNG